LLFVHYKNWQLWRREQAFCAIYHSALFVKKPGTRVLELESIKDLRALLTQSPTGLPIHYPRPPYEGEPNGDLTKPNPEGMQFEWFVGNKRRDQPIPLPLAGEAEEGFPLLRKNGNPE
jgi:hypothetical protein